MKANKNFAKWLSCGIQISGTFGLHHVLQHEVNLIHLQGNPAYIYILQLTMAKYSLNCTSRFTVETERERESKKGIVDY
jgi:hypothetical protein